MAAGASDALPPLDVSEEKMAGWRAAAEEPSAEAVRVDVLSLAVTGASRANLRHLSGVVSWRDGRFDW